MLLFSQYSNSKRDPENLNPLLMFQLKIVIIDNIFMSASS